MNKIIVQIVVFLLLNNSSIFAETVTELVTQSDSYLNKQDFDKAIKFAKNALELESVRRGNLSENYAVILGRLGSINYQSGDNSEAEKYYNESINILKDNFGIQNDNYLKQINDIACIYQNLGRYRESEKLLKEVISSKEEKGVKDYSYAISLHNLAKLYQTLSKYEQAEKNYLEALRIYEANFDKQSIQYAMTLLNYGLLLGDLGNFKKAIDKANESIKILSISLSNTNSLVKTSKLQLALLYLAMNDHNAIQQSMNEFHDVEKTFKTKTHPDYAPTLFNLAMIYWSQRNYDEAKRLLTEAMSIGREQFGKGSSIYSSCLNALGLVCWALKEYNTALQYLTNAVDIRKEIYGEDNPKYATSLHNLAGLLSHIGQKEEALIYYRKSMQIYFDQVDKNFPFLSENEKTNYYELLKERLDLYNCYLLQSMEDNPTLICDMYNNQILWKGILFKDNQKIKHNILSSNNPDLLATFKKWQDTKETLARLYAFSNLELNDMGMLVEELEEQVRNYEKDLSKNCNIFEKSIHRPQIIWQDIQKGLKEDEAMVEIVCFDYFRNDWTDTTIYLALIITKESKDYPDFVVLDKDNMLEKNYLKGYYRGIEGQIQDDSDKELYNVFWGSIEKIIPGKKKIYLCPDGIYNNINLNTLTDMTDKYFIDKYELVLLSNSSSILEKNIQSDNSDKLKTANLFGFPGSNIQYSDQKEYIRSLELISDKFEFSDLPNTKVEIQLIDSLLINNGYETKVFLRKEANEKRFKEIQNTDLLHIATHGIFLSDDKLESYDKIYGIDVDRFIDNPLLRSGLLLTAKDNENGILTAYEVKDMNFEGTKLVVLSACETGSGKILNGEGIFGLQRAFLMAGSEAVIMTLWKVEDKATQKLMVIFYKKWLSGLSVREALKKAQIEIKNEGQPPFFWGAFVVVGE